MGSLTVSKGAQVPISLPEWLLSKTREMNRLEKWQTLSEGQRLTSEEREWCENQISALKASLALQKPNERQTIAEVGSFLMTYSNANLSEDAKQARGYAYWVALEDIPNWALTAAIKRWHRHEVVAKVNYGWPEPGSLRDAAIEVMELARGKKVMLERLLKENEKPLPMVYSDEHRREMLTRMQGLFTPKREALG